MEVPRVLLVDDTPANLIALGAVLRPLGAELVEARSGAEAIESVAAGSFAVALLDVQMPSMDGFETAARIRATAAGRDLPIIFLTAIHRDERYARKGYSTGAADYITKPYDADILRARVKAFVDLFRQREDLRRREVETRTRERDEAVRRLVALERISTAALEEGDVGALLRKLLGVFLEAADSADSAAILLRDGPALRVRASVGPSGLSADDAVLVGDGFAGTLAATGAPLSLGEGSPAASGSKTHAMPPGVRALFGVPLVHDGEITGVAQIGSTKNAAFSELEKRLFIAMADRAAWAVGRRFRLDRFHSLLMTAPAVVSIFRVPGYSREFANLACQRLFGGRDLVGASPAELGPTPEVYSMLDRVALHGETVAVSEHRVVCDWHGTGANEERFFNATLQPLRSPLGKVEAILSLSIDVTEQVRSRQELERSARERTLLLESERAARADAELANRAKDDFLATVSHELRTPLNAILGWTVIAQRGAPPELQRSLSIIERNARTQTRIIEDVLDVSRIISGKLRLVLSPSDVNAAIEGAIEAVRPTAEAKGVTLEAKIGALGVIDADGERLQQIIWNVLSNAIKFTPKGGSVHLAAAREDFRVVIRVRDTGEGIDPAFVPYLFDPFRQADGSTTRRHGGLGLGLAIVKQLVQAHGGSVTAASDGANRGATFTLDLPAGSTTPNTRAPYPVPSPGGSGPTRLDGVRLLAVDDQEDARQLIKEILSERGADVTCAASASEALDRIADVRPHVLVSDLGMPELDGLALIQCVRNLPADRGGLTPAIALTAYAHGDDTQRALAAGFQMHLAKPVDPASLALAVARLAHVPKQGPVGRNPPPQGSSNEPMGRAGRTKP
jgi:signal transduction histidine kinase/DNA-binding response OmpR family regulator